MGHAGRVSGSPEEAEVDTPISHPIGEPFEVIRDMCDAVDLEPSSLDLDEFHYLPDGLRRTHLRRAKADRKHPFNLEK